MDYLQYSKYISESLYDTLESFKPCYKWITFNTNITILELVIILSFKPCYKWITFNTETMDQWTII